jgi:hypothetical protein
MAPDTSDYSSTKAPDTAEHAEERDSVIDFRLIPGGAEPRTDTPQGMEGLDRQQLPGAAAHDDATTDHAED